MNLLSELEITVFKCRSCGSYTDSLDVGHDEKTDSLICPHCENTTLRIQTFSNITYCIYCNIFFSEESYIT